MTTVFVGGSRHVPRLPDDAQARLNTIIGSGFDVVVGDADGADAAVQAHLRDAGYGRVTVFCSGGRCRNNLGGWPTRAVSAPATAKGFQFYAAKDREMARAADYGLMIWDGSSPGTVLNVLRLVGAGKKAVLLTVPGRRATTFKTAADWSAFLAGCDAALRRRLRDRATPEEWRLSDPQQAAGLFDAADR